MANLAGVRSTDLGTGSTYSTLKPEVYEAIFNYDPYQTPITQFFMANKLAKYAVGNPKFQLEEDVLVPRTVALTAAITGGSTTATITTSADDNLILKAGTMILIPSTGDVGWVTTAAATSTTVTVTKVPAGNFTTTTDAAETLRVIGSAYAENSAAATAVSTIPSFPYNYTQIQKKAINMSGTMMASVNYGGDGFTNQRVKATKEIKEDIEDTWLYGVRSIIATASGNKRFTSGLLDSSGIGISNASQFPGTSTFCDESFFFNTYCKNLFAKGSGRKTLYVGGMALLAINEFQKVKLQTRPLESEYGVDVRTIVTPFGRLDLVWNPRLDQGQYPYYGIGVDRDNYLKYAYLSGNGINRDLQYQTEVGTVGVDGKTDQYLMEAGLALAGGGQGIHRVIYPGATS